MTTTTVQNLKKSIRDFVYYMAKCNAENNQIYSQIADEVWSTQISPFVKNEDIKTWELDIHNKFIRNPYVRFDISEKQAYCLARAYSAINPNTITA